MADTNAEIDLLKKQLESRAQKQKAAGQEDESAEKITPKVMDGSVDQMCYEYIVGVLEVLKRFKPDDRSEKDRRYAILITKMEDVEALFYRHVLGR